LIVSFVVQLVDIASSAIYRDSPHLIRGHQ